MPSRVQSRPGLTSLVGVGTSAIVHSIKRLNDQTASDYTRIVGAGTKLYFGKGSLAQIDTGYSGNPLSMVAFEPAVSPSPWIYIMDGTKGGRKVNVAGTVYAQGIAPPLAAPTVVNGPPSFQIIDLFSGSPPGKWVVSGTASTIVNGPVLSTTILKISYDTGNFGWASVVPTGTTYAVTPGAGSFMTVGTGATQETVIITSAQAALSPTTIGSITYDSGSTGLCTIYPAAAFAVVPGQEVIINSGEGVFVISIGTDTVGNFYFRTSTALNHSPGESLASPNYTLRCYLDYTHSVGEAIAAGLFAWDVAVGTGLLSELVSFDLAVIEGRPQQSTDVVSFWINSNGPTLVSNLRIEFDVDASINDFSTNYYYADVDISGFSIGIWTLVSVPISGFTRVGAGAGTWANVAAVGIALTVSSSSVYTLITGLSINGQYGPNSTVAGASGYTYVQRYRSAALGVKSNPGPAIRPAISVDNQSLVVIGTVSPDPQVDTVDFFRLGGTSTAFLYIASAPNSGTPQILDVFGDLDIASAEQLETDLYQPFPVPGLPVSGVCNVSGYAVTWVSGSKFNTSWPLGTGILINGIANTLYSQPTVNTACVLQDAMGVLNNVSFSVPNPILMAQPMTVMFGIYGEGNAGLTLFGVGNSLNAGTLFWTNGNDADSADVANSLQITSPSEALMNGGVYADQPFVFSIKRLFRLVPNFATDANGNPLGGYLAYDEGSGYGLAAPWALCVGPRIYYYAGDSIRESTLGGVSESITDPDLALLFPHGESAGVAVQIGGVTIYPPDPTQTARLRLSFHNSHLFFDYIDTQSNATTLCWNPITRSWGLDTSSMGLVCHYLDEAQGSTLLLAGGADGNVYEYSNAAALDEPFVLKMPTRGDGWTFLQSREIYFALAMATTGSIIINVDGVDYSTSIPATAGGAYARAYYNLPSLKGQAWSWGVTSSGATEIYTKDTMAMVKEWAAKEYKPDEIFRDLNRQVKP